MTLQAQRHAGGVLRPPALRVGSSGETDPALDPLQIHVERKGEVHPLGSEKQLARGSQPWPAAVWGQRAILRMHVGSVRCIVGYPPTSQPLSPQGL